MSYLTLFLVVYADDLYKYTGIIFAICSSPVPSWAATRWRSRKLSNINIRIAGRCHGPRQPPYPDTECAESTGRKNAFSDSCRLVLHFILSRFYSLYAVSRQDAWPPGPTHQWHTDGEKLIEFFNTFSCQARLFVYYRLVDTIFWKRMNRILYKWEQVARGAKAWNDLLSESRG